MNGAIWYIELIARDGCATYYGGRRSCRDLDSGRVPDARYGADQWCPACLAKAALELL